MDELIAASGSNLPKSELQKIIEEANRQLAEKTAAMKAEEERRRGEREEAEREAEEVKARERAERKKLREQKHALQRGSEGTGLLEKVEKKEKEGKPNFEKALSMQVFSLGNVG